MNTFDPKNWLARHTGVDNYDIETLAHVLWFTLIWNRFELKICDRSASMDVIDSKVAAENDAERLHWDDFENFWRAFQKEVETVDDLHYYLLSDPRPNSRPNDTEQRRVDELIPMLQKKQLPDVVDGVKAMLFIAYRVRNNFFHGEKCVNSLSAQRPLFEILNEMLAKIIDAFSRQN